MFLINLYGCTSAEITITPGMTATAKLTPYLSPTASQISLTKVPTIVTATDLPTTTPTPITYTIVAGDTLLAIALRYGISLEELQAANPEVDPRLLSVGTLLVIPLEQSVPSGPATATPIPLEPVRTDCYRAPDGIWCFPLVFNDRSRPLENISARVVLYNEKGEMVTEGVAVSAINKLPVDEEMPLTVLFPIRNMDSFQAMASILSVQPVPKNDSRYLNGWVETEEVLISADGKSAKVSGNYGLPAKSAPGNLTWVFIIAYDKDGHVVGVRKVEQYGLLEPGQAQDFEIDVFSLGPQIAEIKTLIEIRP
ncbi:MAG: LysM peptidoglycan-binding domain-containing protein [Chloroflexota bacterium]|nr:MAG: LysM peptidoglycan-binding domain-containing protein [Chloroflexota bacterium]